MSRPERSSQRQPETKTNRVALVLVLVAIVIIIAGVAQLKALNAPQKSIPEISANGTAVEQMKRALDADMPTVVFMHSTDCIPCKDLMQVMDQVYPEYADEVVLVDVDIYNSANEPIIRGLGLRSIPTTVFFDRRGQSWTAIGTMSPNELRKQIEQRALGS